MGWGDGWMDGNAPEPGVAAAGVAGVPWAGEVVVDEVEFVGRELVHGAEDAVVGDDGAQVAAEGVALDPVGHVAFCV